MHDRYTNTVEYRKSNQLAHTGLSVLFQFNVGGGGGREVSRGGEPVHKARLSLLS